MPRVLRIINRFNLGGISYNVSYLSKYLAPEYETLLIGGPEEEGEESSLYIPRSLGLEPTLIYELRRSVSVIDDYKAYKKIKQVIRDFKPDIVHTHASKAGAIGRMAAFHCKVPIVVHTFHGHVFHSYFGKIKTEIFKIIERYLAKKSSAIIAISQVQKKELSDIHKICKADKIHVIPLGFDLKKFNENTEEKRKRFRNLYGLTDDTLAIGIIGRLAPIKNHALFIDAIKKLKEKSGKKFKAFIIGDGEIKLNLMNYASQIGLKHGQEFNSTCELIFTSWIKDVDEALAGLDLVCLSSKNEGTPVSLIEAQAAGKFIVTTNVGGIQDILHPDCGLLSKVGDNESFEQNLLLAVEQFSELSRKSTSAKDYIIQHYHYSRLCTDTKNLYHKLIQVSR